MKEVWKEIKGYEEYYQVSNLGRIRRSKNKIIKKQSLHYCGYLRSNFCKYGKAIKFYIHRLVAQAFIPNLENKPQVNHIDGNKQNNKIDNLEWTTASENEKHSYNVGLKKGRKGELHPLSILTDKQVIEIKKELKNYKRGMCVKLAKKYNVKYKVINSIKNNQRWIHIKV